MRAVKSHIPHEQPRTCYQNRPTSKRLGTQTCPFGRRSCCANRKRPPLRMASVDQGYAIRDGFPSSLSLEPNGHISASCHCHPLSIRSGLAPSSQLLRPKLQARSTLLRRHWTICLTPGQWCVNVQVLVCLDALWVRRTSRKSRQVRRHHLSGQAV